jgi:hypothetical protein
MRIVGAFSVVSSEVEQSRSAPPPTITRADAASAERDTRPRRRKRACDLGFAGSRREEARVVESVILHRRPARLALCRTVACVVCDILPQFSDFAPLRCQPAGTRYLTVDTPPYSQGCTRNGIIHTLAPRRRPTPHGPGFRTGQGLQSWLGGAGRVGQTRCRLPRCPPRR